MSKVYLAHHGIKGQRWGIRRFEDRNGHLTSAGKKRYDVDESTIKAQKKAVKMAKAKVKTSYGSEYSKNLDKLHYEKEQLKNDKIKLKLNKSGKEIKGGKYYNKKLEEYRKAGYSQEEAEINAYRADRGRKFAIALGVTALTAAAAYGGYRYYKHNVDGTIKAGAKLQNVSNHARKTTEALYTSHTPLDNVKYRGLYGNVQMRMMGNDAIYKNTIHVNKNIKVASHKSAANVLTNLWNSDKEYANAMSNNIREMYKRYYTNPMLRGTKQCDALSKAVKELDSGKPGKNTYKAVNFLLGVHEGDLNTNNAKFYSALKKSGYSALRDFNDERLSGYASKSANIIFDGADKISIGKTVQLNNKSKNAVDTAIGFIAINGRQIAPAVAAVAGALKIQDVKDNNTRITNESKVVNSYKKKHPGTKLSTEEILKNYYGS